MADSRKKIVAALAAVNAYLKEEATRPPRIKFPSAPSLWAVAGRLEIMGHRLPATGARAQRR